MILSAGTPVALIGGGELGPGDLDAVLGHADIIAAADSGARAALRAGHMPHAVIGDMDSIDAETLAALPDERVHRIPEQDSTDFDKCLRHIRAPLVLAAGFSGARNDHLLAAANTLVVRAAQRCVLLGQRDVMFLCPPELALELPAGEVFSLFPMGAVEGVSEGLRWPIAGLNFAPDRRVGTSNETVGPVRLSVTAPKMLALAPRAHLDAVVRGLCAAQAGWTVGG